MAKLGVNIDHVATLRQARRADEPDPARAAAAAERGGADGITVHLREDRRHIQDADVRALVRFVRTVLNLELGATPDIVRLAPKPSLREASCCSVLVVNGAPGLRLPGFWSMDSIVNVALAAASRKLRADDLSLSLSASSALSPPPLASKSPATLKLLCGSKSLISRSRSTTRRTVTD